MSDSFVPLLPHLPRGNGVPSGATPIQVLAQQRDAHRFQPMTEREPKSTAGNGFSAAPAAACASQPRVTLVREGEIVKRIQVQCGCGQLIELDCV